MDFNVFDTFQLDNENLFSKIFKRFIAIMWLSQQKLAMFAYKQKIILLLQLMATLINYACSLHPLANINWSEAAVLGVINKDKIIGNFNFMLWHGWLLQAWSHNYVVMCICKIYKIIACMYVSITMCTSHML